MADANSDLTKLEEFVWSMAVASLVSNEEFRLLLALLNTSTPERLGDPASGRQAGAYLLTVPFDKLEAEFGWARDRIDTLLNNLAAEGLITRSIASDVVDLTPLETRAPGLRRFISARGIAAGADPDRTEPARS